MEKRSHRRIRDLDVFTAFQGLVSNEIGCARISMMAREQNTPFNGPNTDARDQASPDRHIRLAPHGRSIHKYMVRGGTPPSQSWKTFLRNHAQAIAAIDLCVVPTLTFERLFAFLVLGHGRRQLLWIEVTRHPTAEWLARQITEAFPWTSAPAYLVRDNDGLWARLHVSGEGHGYPRPADLAWIAWQNGRAERLIGTVRRECLDRMLGRTASSIRPDIIFGKDNRAEYSRVGYGPHDDINPRFLTTNVRADFLR